VGGFNLSVGVLGGRSPVDTTSMASTSPVVWDIEAAPQIDRTSNRLLPTLLVAMLRCFIICN